jgi:hypothetical protein
MGGERGRNGLIELLQGINDDQGGGCLRPAGNLVTTRFNWKLLFLINLIF